MKIKPFRYLPSILVTISLVLVLFSCGQKDDSTNTSSNDNSSNNDNTSTTTDNTVKFVAGGKGTNYNRIIS